VHYNWLSLAHFGSPATYIPAVMLTAGELSGASGIKNLPLAHIDGCVGDNILSLAN
jgi:hypothetical protein